MNYRFLFLQRRVYFSQSASCSTQRINLRDQRGFQQHGQHILEGHDLSFALSLPRIADIYSKNFSYLLFGL